MCIKYHQTTCQTSRSRPRTRTRASVVSERRWSARRAVVGSASQLNPEAHHNNKTARLNAPQKDRAPWTALINPPIPPPTPARRRQSSNEVEREYDVGRRLAVRPGRRTLRTTTRSARARKGRRRDQGTTCSRLGARSPSSCRLEEPAKRTRAVRYGDRKPWSRGSEPAAVDLTRCRCRGSLTNNVEWSASLVGHEDNHAESASARVLRGRRASFPRGEAHTGRSARDSETVETSLRSRSRAPGAVSVRRSLGQRLGVERVARWPRRQPRQVRQRASAPCPDGRFSTAQRAHGPCGIELVRRGHEAPKPQPSAWRGVGAKEPWPTAWGGARRSFAAKTTTPSPPARVCSVGG